MFEIIIILIVVGCIVWVVWTMRKHKHALAKIALDDAWREVLNDPHYIDRRRHEDRKHAVDEARAHAANR
jgi:cbb3-type cytochrome oxidase subunit 3